MRYLGNEIHNRNHSMSKEYIVTILTSEEIVEEAREKIVEIVFRMRQSHGVPFEVTISDIEEVYGLTPENIIKLCFNPKGKI